MSYKIDSGFTWDPPPAGQELTLTWSFADSDTVDKTLIFGQSDVYVSPSGYKLTFQGYPDFSGTITGSDRDIVRNAFGAWDINSGVRFVEVADSKNADIRIGIFDTGGGLVNSAESSYGAMKMWRDNDFNKVAIEISPNAFTSVDRFTNTVLHQIGHSLGLDDTAGLFVSSSPDVMNPTLTPTHLSADDIRGVQSLYGSQPPAPDYVTQVARLYEAGLDRSFDASGLNYWIDQREAGVSLATMAAQFLDSAEFTQRFGDDDAMSNSTFVSRIYTNVLDRAPDASGATFWLSAMNSGMTHEQVLIAFSDSAENRAHATYLSNLTQTQSGWWDLA